MNEEPNALDLIRREMDEIDTQLLALLGARFAATARVKAIKGPAPSPMRPGREAAILRRLCEAEAPGDADESKLTDGLAVGVAHWRSGLLRSPDCISS